MVTAAVGFADERVPVTPDLGSLAPIARQLFEPTAAMTRAQTP